MLGKWAKPPMALFNFVKRVVQYQRDVTRTAWLTSFSKVTWWKGFVACLVLGSLLGISSTSFDELGSDSAIKAASSALGAALLAFIDLMPESPGTPRHFKTVIRVLLGWALVMTGLHWLMGELDGRLVDYARIAAPAIALFVSLVGGLLFIGSMHSWEDQVHSKRKKDAHDAGEEGS